MKTLNRAFKLLKIITGERKQMEGPKKNSEQAGIALIMTLGVLSMLILLALAFASSARTSSKMANNEANSTNARMIAEGALDRVFGVTELTGSLYDKSRKIGNFNYNGDNYADGLYRDGLSNLTSTNVDGSGLYNYSTADQVEWVNVMADGKIIGRFAFIAFVGSGNIDPNAAVLHSADAPGAQNELTYTQLRPGVNVYELSLADLDPDATYLTSAMVAKLSSDAVTGVGLLSDGGRWPDFTTIYDPSNLNIGSVTQHDRDTREKFEQSFFILDGGLDPNAFWVDDVSVDGTRDDSSELDIRFNVARTDWDDNHASDGQDYDPEGDGGETNGEGDQDGYDRGSDGVPDRNDDALAFMNDYILVDPNDWDSSHTDVDGRGIRWLNTLKGANVGGSSTCDAASFLYPNSGVRIDWGRNPYTDGTASRPAGFGIDIRAKQIAANLIDASDADSIPTSDKDPMQWSPTSGTNAPLFVGNEMTPVLSETWCGFDVQFETVAHSDPTRIIWRYTLTGFTGVEIHNPWPVDLPGNCMAFCGGNRKLSLGTGNGGQWHRGPSRYSFGSWPGIIMPQINGPFPAGSYRTSIHWFNPHRYPWAGDYISNAYNNKVFNRTEVIANITANATVHIDWDPQFYMLKYDPTGTVSDMGWQTGGEVVDYWRGVMDYRNGGYQDFTMGDVDGTVVGNTFRKSVYLHYSAKDPRQNTFINDWDSGVNLYSRSFGVGQHMGAGIIDGPLPGYGAHASETPNAPNSNDLRASTGDEENKFPLVSSSYIRNAPMESLWEIGSIHRGAAWESLNIDKYDDVTPGIMDSYANGDANILDQLKMTNNRELYGKFNLNTTSSDCLRALTKGIHVGTGYEFPSGDTDGDGTPDAGTAINRANAETIANSISSALTETWQRRSQVATASALSDDSITGITQDTDAKREEIIGKFINLTKAVSASSGTIGSSANLLIIAQAIKDVGGITIYKDVDFDGDTDGADEIVAGLDLDGDGSIGNTDVNETINTTYGTYDLHADEILSEVKMFAIISYDSTEGVWKASKKVFIE